MTFFSEDMLNYLEDHFSDPDSLLNELERQTHLRQLNPAMLVGPYLGRVLVMISQMIKPHRVLEIGTFTGYSAYCLAQGLSTEGALITIEVNEEQEKGILNFFDKAGLSDTIQLIIGDALEIIPSLNEVFDLVFIDANKMHNTAFYELALEKLQPGGFILVDNVLWFGNVINPTNIDGRTIAEFNLKIQEDPRVENVILPLRDGLMLIRKK